MVRNLLFIVLLAMIEQVAAQSFEKKTKSQVLFSVKKNPTYTDEFIYLYKKNHLNTEDFTEKKIDEYLNLFINFKLKVAEAKSHGLDTTDAFRKEFKTYKEELKKPFIAEKDELDRLTREAYQRLTEEVKASHILIGLKPDATPADTLVVFNKIMTVRNRITSGEDFEKVAKEISEDPSAKTNGGSLGYFTALQMVYPFEQAAYSLNVGEVSQPVRTRFGYHLIKVFDRRQARGEVEVSHIILRTGTSDDKKVKNKILEIYDQVRAGRKWEELVSEYSEDAATKDTGGKLRPVGVGALAGIPEFEKVVFSLKNPGDYSDPFQSAYGWHIVRLERKIPIPPYSEVESVLKKKVSRDERLQIADKKREQERKKQYGLIEYPDVKNVFKASADTSLQQGKWQYKGEESFKTKILFRLQNKDYTAGSFINYIRKNSSLTVSEPTFYMMELYNSFLSEQLNEIEDEKLLAKNADFRNLLTEYKEGILLFTIMEKEVWNRGSEDTLAMRKFYNENRSKYTAGDRVHGRVFTTTDKNFLEEIKIKISNGDSLKKDDLKKFKSITPFRNYARGDNKAVDKAAWSIGLHDAESDGNYYLVEIDNLVPPGIKTMEESRAQVVGDRQDSLEKKWLEELRRRYPVKINNKGKKFVVSELTKK